MEEEVKGPVFITGEYTPGGESALPQTPAERAVAAGGKLAAIISAPPLRDPEWLGKTGGVPAWVGEYLEARDRFEDALYEVALDANNAETREMLTRKITRAVELGIALGEGA